MTTSRLVVNMKLFDTKEKIPIACRQELVEMISPLISETPFSQYSRRQIIDTLLIAALQHRSLESVVRFPNSDTVFTRIIHDKFGLRKLIEHLRPNVHGPVILAIDGHDEMYYGKRADGVIGTENKKGTCWAFKFLAVKIIVGRQRFIVDIISMDSGSVVQSTIDALNRLLKVYNIKRVVMDGEFQCTRILQYLANVGIDYVIRRRTFAGLEKMALPYNVPVPYSSKEKSRNDRPDTLRVEYYVYRFHGRKSKARKKTDFYLVSNLNTTAKRIIKMFKKRWQIETGFREVNRVKIRTCTRDHFVRVFFYVIACAIYNIWISLRSKKRNVLRLDTVKHILLDFIIRQVKSITIKFFIDNG